MLYATRLVPFSTFLLSESRSTAMDSAWRTFKLSVRGAGWLSRR